MQILIIEPERKPKLCEIDGTLRTMQKIVGGTIQSIYPFDDTVALICNDNGKIENLPANRALRNKEGQIYDIIFGTFFLCGFLPDGEDFISLTERQIKRYQEYFHTPEMFWGADGQIICLPLDVDTTTENADPV